MRIITGAFLIRTIFMIMNLKRIIREEINNNLLMEGKLNDMFKKFNMTQIKKELKERLDIDETSTKMEVAKKLIKYTYKLNLKLLKYELGAVLGGFIFYFLSIVLDVAGVEPFVTDGEPTMPHFILWGAGALLNVIRMVRKDLKEEKDDMEWIEDIKSNQDIAQDIADKTEIKDNRIYSPFFPSHLRYFVSPFPSPSLAPLFFTYCEEQYGLTKKDSKDVWDRYKKIIKVLNSNINRFRLKESDFDWIDDNPFEVDNCFLITNEPMGTLTNSFFRKVLGYYFHLPRTQPERDSYRYGRSVFKIIIKINNIKLDDDLCYHKGNNVQPCDTSITFKPFIYKQRYIGGEEWYKYTSSINDFTTTLSEVEKWIEQGNIVITDCPQISNYHPVMYRT